MICTALNADETIAPFSSGKYLIVYDEVKKEVAVSVRNPAITKKNRRFRFAKECMNLNANIVIVPRGSLSYSAYRSLRKGKVKILISSVGEKFPDCRTSDPSIGEVLRSSLSAFKEKITRKQVQTK
ncbi:MAG: hypothetical protein AAE977_04665 [Thermoplasmataceae archaeon]|jgi:hypothetical protein